MTSGIDQLGTTIAELATPADGVELIQGVVASIGPPIRVDALGRSLSCVALSATVTGATVWVLSVGQTNLIVGDELPGNGVTGSLGFQGTFQGAWQNFGSGWKGLSIRRIGDGTIDMTGLVAGGLSGSLVVIDPDWRPVFNEMFPAVCAVGGAQRHCRLEVESGGLVNAVFEGGGNSQFFAVDAHWTLD